MMTTDGTVIGVKMVVQSLPAQKCVYVSCKPKHRTLFIPLSVCLAICIVAVWLTCTDHGCSDYHETRSRDCPWTAVAGNDKTWERSNGGLCAATVTRDCFESGSC